MDERLQQRAAVVALLRLPQVSWPEVAATVIERGEAASLLEERLGDDAALFTFDGPVDALLDSAASDIKQWEASGIGVHTCLDDAYPEQLRDIHQAPPVVFTQGRLAADRRAVAVVGTRKATPHGIRAAETISTSLAEAGVTVVSGLAAGIDTAAHRAVLEAGGRTVAVIGTGINRSYPAANERLQRRIAADGLVLSQFWPDATNEDQLSDAQRRDVRLRGGYRRRRSGIPKRCSYAGQVGSRARSAGRSSARAA